MRLPASEDASSTSDIQSSSKPASRAIGNSLLERPGTAQTSRKFPGTHV
jgi:hypothetical protein